MLFPTLADELDEAVHDTLYNNASPNNTTDIKTQLSEYLEHLQETVLRLELEPSKIKEIGLACLVCEWLS